MSRILGRPLLPVLAGIAAALGGRCCLWRPQRAWVLLQLPGGCRALGRRTRQARGQGGCVERLDPHYFRHREDRLRLSRRARQTACEQAAARHGEEENLVAKSRILPQRRPIYREKGTNTCRPAEPEAGQRRLVRTDLGSIPEPYTRRDIPARSTRRLRSDTAQVRGVNEPGSNSTTPTRE